MNRSQRPIFFSCNASSGLLAVLVLTMVGLVTSCGPKAPDSRSYRTFVDGLDHEVRVPDPITRVVTLAPGVTEMVIAAGGLTSLVGVSNADNYPDAVLSLPSFSALPVNLEAVAALEPDIVFATSQVNDARAAAAFANLGIPVFFLKTRRLEDVFSSIQMISAILGTDTIARAMTDSLEERVRRLSVKTSNLRRPGVLFLISTGALHSFGPESYIHDLVHLAGGLSITADFDVENPILSDEFVLSAKPDVIVGTFGTDFHLSNLLDEHPTWNLVPAVRKGRVYSIDGDLVLRAGPRNVDGAEVLFGMIHPENRPGINP